MSGGRLGTDGTDRSITDPAFSRSTSGTVGAWRCRATRLFTTTKGQRNPIYHSGSNGGQRTVEEYVTRSQKMIYGTPQNSPVGILINFGGHGKLHRRG